MLIRFGSNINFPRSEDSDRDPCYSLRADEPVSMQSACSHTFDPRPLARTIRQRMSGHVAASVTPTSDWKTRLKPYSNPIKFLLKPYKNFIKPL